MKSVVLWIVVLHQNYYLIGKWKRIYDSYWSDYGNDYEYDDDTGWYEVLLGSFNSGNHVYDTVKTPYVYAKSKTVKVGLKILYGVSKFFGLVCEKYYYMVWLERSPSFSGESLSLTWNVAEGSGTFTITIYYYN